MTNRSECFASRVLSPDDAAALKGVFDQAWHALDFAFDSPETPDACETRDKLARLVLIAVSEGTRAPKEIIGKALGRLDPLPARWADDA